MRTFTKPFPAMTPKFRVLFMEEASQFIARAEPKAREKILYVIRLASLTNDSVLFKKLRDDIWEFRCFYNKKQYRMLAFWDKENGLNTLVIATHGFVKTTAKAPLGEIERAIRLRNRYFTAKSGH